MTFLMELALRQAASTADLTSPAFSAWSCWRLPVLRHRSANSRSVAPFVVQMDACVSTRLRAPRKHASITRGAYSPQPGLRRVSSVGDRKEISSVST